MDHEAVERLCAIMLEYGDGEAPRQVARLRLALACDSPALAARARNAWDNCMWGGRLPTPELREEAGTLLAGAAESEEG